MQSPLDELRAEMEAAVLKAHRAGMRYDAIRAEVATVGDRVRMAQRAQVLDRERREQAQPSGRGTLRTGYQPIGKLVKQALAGSAA